METGWTFAASVAVLATATTTILSAGWLALGGLVLVAVEMWPHLRAHVPG